MEKKAHLYRMSYGTLLIELDENDQIRVTGNACKSAKHMLLKNVRILQEL